ncbi:MAG: hypothetical protein QJR00_02205 [Bacillota bacterium]|nr:hypothetical protein [Bacillota bacterium]
MKRKESLLKRWRERVAEREARYSSLHWSNLVRGEAPADATAGDPMGSLEPAIEGQGPLVERGPMEDHAVQSLLGGYTNAAEQVDGPYPGQEKQGPLLSSLPHLDGEEGEDITPTQGPRGVKKRARRPRA